MKKLKQLFFSRWALFCCGFISFFAFAPYFIFPVLWFGLAFLSAKNNRAGHKESFLNAFAFGAGLGISGMNWLSYALQLDNGAYQWCSPLVWIGFAFLFGLYYGLTAWAASYAKSGVARWLAFAGWFGVFEWLRGWVCSGFPWNVVGNIWNGYLPMLQSVSVIGVYGLGILTVLIFTIPNVGRKFRPTVVALSALGLLYGLGAWRLYAADEGAVWGVRLRLVQPDIPCTLKWDPNEAGNNIAKMIRLSRENNEEITHIIWPEAAMSFYINTEHNARLGLMPAMRQGSVLITGAMRLVDKSRNIVANSLVVLDDLTDIKAVYDKSHLVPFGEYAPLRGILPIEKFVPFSSDIYAGPGARTIPVVKAPNAGGMICYEAIFSGAVVDKKKRPEWLINVTNDGWYGLSAGPHHHFAMAQTRAVEEGLPMARAANNGISAVVDGYGRIQKMLPLGAEGVVDSELPKALPPTPFARFGNAIPLILAGFLIIFSFFKQKSA